MGWHALPHATPFGFRVESGRGRSARAEVVRWSRGQLPRVGTSLAIHGEATRVYAVYVDEIDHLPATPSFPRSGGNQNNNIDNIEEDSVDLWKETPSLDFLSCSHLGRWASFRNTLFWRDGEGVVLDESAVSAAKKVIADFGLLHLSFDHALGFVEELYHQLEDGEHSSTEHCPLGVALALHIALADAKRAGAPEVEVSALREALYQIVTFVLQVAPFLHVRSSGHTEIPSSWHHDWSLDFLDSANWTIRSSWDLLVNLQSESFHDYGAYALAHPMLQHERLGFSVGLSPTAAAACRRPPLKLRPIVFCTHSSLARESALALRAALRRGDGDSLLATPRMVFTESLEDTSCVECRLALGGVITVDRSFLHSWRARRLSIPNMVQELSQLLVGPTVWGFGRQGPSPRDLLVVVEPFWLAPILAAVLRRPVLVLCNVAMLLEFPSKEQRDIIAWWSLFHAMLAIPGTAAAATNLFLQAHAREQGGRRFTYVPILGLHTQLVVAPRSQRHEVLVFRAEATYTQTLYVKLLRRLTSLWDSKRHVGLLPARLVVQSGAWHPSFNEVAAFSALVILPKQVNEVKLSDIFAMRMVTYTPAEPLVHRFIWPYAKPFGLWVPDPSEKAALLSRSPWLPVATNTPGTGGSDCCQAVETRNGTGRTSPRPSALALGELLGPMDTLDAQRFWWLRTEWALLQRHGIQGFRGAAELLWRLMGLNEGEATRIRRLMGKFQRKRLRGALSWWRRAAAGAAAHTLNS